MKRILLGAGAALVVIAGTVYFTLIAAKYAPEECTYELDLGTLRSLAASLPGEKAAELRVEDVTGGRFPKAVACPGQSWDKVRFRVYSYQLVFPDRTLVVDTAMDPAQARTLDMSEGYDDAAWQRVAKAMAAASAVYVTHEHADHMGGAFADDRWAGNLRLTPQQLDSSASNRPTISAAARAAVKTVAYERYQAVAPGVVLIEARGHTPGSQMVFVTRADGAEVLLTGDTAWLMDNVEREQGPAKLVTVLMGSDRNRNACQLKALHRILTSDSKVAIMSGHDEEQMKALIGKKVFISGFR